MRTSDFALRHGSRLRPLAACLALAFSANIFASSEAVNEVDANTFADITALSSAFAPFENAFPTQPTSTLLVKNCDDHGPDSLRDSIASATDGSTIQFDMNAMACSTISLTTGQIDILVDNLTIAGPGSDLLTIDGGYSSGYYNRIFNHPTQGAIGTLQIGGLTLADALYMSAGDAQGGCIYSHGTVRLIGSTVTNCSVLSTGQRAYGGGIRAALSLEMLNSRVTNCIALSTAGDASGGGVAVGGLGGGYFRAKYSAIEYNTSSTTLGTSRGGGILTLATTGIQRSTISGNQADFGGGLFSGSATNLNNSTISGNKARSNGGVDVHDALTVSDSTVVRNVATTFHSTAGVSAVSLQSNSSIFAFNMTDDGTDVVEADVEVGNGMITGASNLIMATDAIPPMNTLSACPRLTPLLDNGGSTRTHALLPGSPGIDVGNNVANLDTDQRGIGFDRLVGANVDIGAYEWSESSGEVINQSGFENCN